MNRKVKSLLSSLLVLCLAVSLGIGFGEENNIEIPLEETLEQVAAEPELLQNEEQVPEEKKEEIENQIEGDIEEAKAIEEENQPKENVETEKPESIEEEKIEAEKTVVENDSVLNPEAEEKISGESIEKAYQVDTDVSNDITEEKQPENEDSVQLQEDEEVQEQINQEPQDKEEIPQDLDENTADEELETLEEDGLLEIVPDDYQLKTSESTEITIPAGAGATAHGSYIMETAGLLTFEFSSPTAGGNVSISIADIDNQIMWSNNWVTNAGTVTCSEFAEAGEYTILFAKSSPADTNSYKLTARPIISREGELETRNNTANNAGLMLTGEEITGIWSYQDILLGRNDYYRFSLSEPGWVTINFTNKTMSNMSLALYGDDTSTENEVTAFSIAGPACSDRNETDSVTVNHSGWLDAGVYYIRIQGGSRNGRYHIKVTNSPITITEKEKNNSFSLAYNSGSELSLTGERTEALLSESNFEDCYWFRVPVATDVGFSVRIQFTGVSAAVYTRDGTMVPGSSFGSNSTTGSDGRPYTLEKAVTLPAGIYYLRISWSAGKYCGRYDVAGYRSLKISDVETILKGATLQLRTYYTIYRSNVISFNYVLEREDPRYPGSGNYYEVAKVEDVEWDAVEVTIPGNGNYRIHAAISDGNGWTDFWKTFTVSSMEPMKVQSVQATSNDAQVTIKAILSGTNTEIVATQFRLRNSSSVIVAEYKGKDETEYILSAPLTGTYTAEYACTVDGIVWEAGSTQVYVNSTTSLSLSEISFQIKNNGTVTATVTQTSGTPITDGWFEFFIGTVKVANVHSGSSLKASVVLTPGTYVVHYSGFNGVWADRWDLLVVPSASVLNVNALNATSDTTGRIFIQAQCSGGVGIGYGVFNIYKNDVLQAKVETTESAITWQAPGNGTYAIQYVAFDGITWAPKWTSVSVTIAPIAPFNISNIVITVNGTKAECKVVTNDDRPINGVFVLYKEGNPVAIEYTQTRVHSFEGLNVGNYAIHYAATDGNVWKEYWKAFSVTSTLTINYVNATRSGAYVNVVAGVTNLTPIREAYMVLYNGAGAEITRYVYKGEGEYLTHTFNVGETPAAIQYVVFDGLKWIDMWAPVV